MSDRTGSPPRGSERVRIVGDHPHKGESGTVGSYDPRSGMWRVALDDNALNVEACFADAENLRPLPGDEDAA